MQKIKIFKGIESELNPLEAEINQWIEHAKARVIQITGNIAPQSGQQTSSMGSMGTFNASDVLIIVLYEDGNG